VTVPAVVADVLLVSGVAIELVCVVGVVWMSNVFDRLHFAAASTTVGPLLVGIAVVLTGMSSLSGVVELTTALGFLILANPVLTHATARAARRLHVGDLDTERTGEGAP
jgi:monovalent cation/proton antiporter MnhG/PhaG subunit